MPSTAMAAPHDFHPIVQIGFVIKHRKAFFDHGFPVVAHGTTTDRWDL